MSGDETQSPVRDYRPRKDTLNFDLNVEPETESLDHEGTFDPSASPQLEARSQGHAQHPATVDTEATDDDVTVCSPTAFAEAKRKARRRNKGTNEVVDVESDDLVLLLDPIIHKRRRGANATHKEIIFYDLGRSNQLRESEPELEQDVTHSPTLTLLPKEPTFRCPICMGWIVKGTSTKCGHIFCKKCICAAISIQKNCPTCRERVVKNDLIRVFLPTG